MSLINFKTNLSIKFPFKNISKSHLLDFLGLFVNFGIFNVKFENPLHSVFEVNSLIEFFIMHMLLYIIEFFIMRILFYTINFARSRSNQSFLFIKIMNLIHYTYDRFIDYIIRASYVLIFSI